MDFEKFVERVGEVARVETGPARRIAHQLIEDYQDTRPIKVEAMGELETRRMLTTLRRWQRAGRLAPDELAAVVDTLAGIRNAEEALQVARGKRDAAITEALRAGATPKNVADVTGLTSQFVRSLRP